MNSPRIPRKVVFIFKFLQRWQIIFSRRARSKMGNLRWKVVFGLKRLFFSHIILVTYFFQVSSKKILSYLWFWDCLFFDQVSSFFFQNRLTGLHLRFFVQPKMRCKLVRNWWEWWQMVFFRSLYWMEARKGQKRPKKIWKSKVQNGFKWLPKWLLNTIWAFQSQMKACLMVFCWLIIFFSCSKISKTEVR